MKIIKIAGVEIAPGEEKHLTPQIARLPSRTVIEIPIIVSRSLVDGPTLLISAGMHGDEVNGIEIVRRIVVNKYNHPLIGTIICIPIINVYGFINVSREVPDGKDINRSFPGTRRGSLASQIAFHIKNEILPLIDFGLDFHTGGARINNFPQVRANSADKVAVELATAFSPKYIINSAFRDKSFRKEAFKYGKSVLVYEGGESLRLRKQAIDEGVDGALRVMQHLKMRQDAPKAQFSPIKIQKSTWIRARSSGMVHTFVRPGEAIKLGQRIGLITGPFGEFEVPLKASLSGEVLAVNNNPVVNRGDALIHVGIPGSSSK